SQRMLSEDKSSTERFIAIAQSDASPYIRATALHRLGHSGNEDGVNVVVSATSDTAWIVRKQAIISLKYFYSKKAEQQLRKLAKDEDPKNQILAIESLYLSQKDDQLSTVLQFLKSDDPTIRNLAAQTFSFVSENRFLTALKGALEDETEPRVIMELEKAITFIEQSR
ncbi:MAG: HEAT repeat domain-containing protein, partial [Candidatus Marinimicrobia bacterium]|nr:HEAT repeat domain-containing protein [Candidatus Neomarinimicrobiota bacterium]